MKFSIIVPIYKVEKYLHECVESILNQSYKDFELILVDDGSPDACPSMCDEYARRDSRIIVIHQQNAGLACARNAGIQRASGDYVICIDSDDYLSNEQVLSKISERAKGNVDAVLYGFRKFFESNSTFGEEVVPILPGCVDTGTMLEQVLQNNSYCGTAWTKAVRLGLLKDNDIEFKPGMISEDIDWYIHILCFAKTFDSINESALIYRQRPGSISHAAKINSLTDNLWILEYWPSRISELLNGSKLEKSMMAVMAYYYANVLILFSGYPPRESLPYQDRIKALSHLLDAATTPRAKFIARFYKVLGFKITVLALRVLSRLKTRQ